MFQRIEENLVKDQAKEEKEWSNNRYGEKGIDSEQMKEPETGIGCTHDQCAMGHIQITHDPEYKGQAKAHEAVKRSVNETICENLDICKHINYPKAK
jgi:hypothetical protein